jgi:hypothetical protein
MPSLRALLCAVMLVAFPASRSMPQSQLKNQSGPSNIPTIQVTSRLVFLDVTVLDKEGNPVVNGLSKGDFTITENEKPQRIFSFEAPQVHTMGAAAVPRKTRSVRVVVETEGGGRIGGADLDRKTVDAAPEAPTPNAQLLYRQQNETPPTPAKP